MTAATFDNIQLRIRLVDISLTIENISECICEEMDGPLQPEPFLPAFISDNDQFTICHDDVRLIFVVLVIFQ